MLEDRLNILHHRVITSFCGVMEFRAFTEYAYTMLSQAASITTDEEAGIVIDYTQFGSWLGISNRHVEMKDLPIEMQKAKEDYLLSLVHQHQVSLFEHIFFDILRVVLLQSPIRLSGDRKIEYSVVFSASTRDEIHTCDHRPRIE